MRKDSIFLSIFLFFLFLTISVNKSLAAKYPSLDVPEDILLHVLPPSPPIPAIIP